MEAGSERERALERRANALRLRGSHHILGWLNVEKPDYILTREDRLSLAFHGAIADKVKAERPRVVAKAGRNAQRLSAQHPRLAKHFERWQRWLGLPAGDLAERITEESEQAVWMRHITVFAGVLNPEERSRIIRAQRTNRL